MEPGYFRLKGRVAVRCSFEEWAKCYETPKDRILKQTTVIDESYGEIFISTVFLGLDHNYSLDPNTLPILFETMVFGGKHDQFQERYPTWDEAVTRHRVVVRFIEFTIYSDSLAKTAPPPKNIQK